MKSADWKRVSKPILQPLEADWGWARTLAYIKPVEWVVHGVLAEKSGKDPDDFFLWVVRMPLMAPLDGVFVLSWSERHGGGTASYGQGSPAAVVAISEAAAIASRNASEGRLLLEPPGGADNLRMQEERAYGLLLVGDMASAKEILRRIERYQARYPWEKDILNRAAVAAGSIELDGGARAVQQLHEWRGANCDALGLSRA